MFLVDVINRFLRCKKAEEPFVAEDSSESMAEATAARERAEFDLFQTKRRWEEVNAINNAIQARRIENNFSWALQQMFQEGRQ
jgi:hypothetical protein